MNPYLRNADRLRKEAELKLQARQVEAVAVEVIDVAVTERARDDEGCFIPDDQATPDVNEAWVDVPQE